MTDNDQMEIRIYQSPPNTDVYRLRTMPLINPAEAVCIELQDGTMLYGVVMSEWDEIRGDSRVLTKTIRVYGIEPGDGAR